MHICVFAQLEDSFSDTNFTQNPAWGGTVNLFTINPAKQLQLNSTVAGEAYLSTSSKVLQNTEWTFYVRLAFSPSATNFARVYLASDKNALNQPVNGYYIQFGEAGSLDGIDLFRQDSLTHTKLIDGKAGTIAKTNNTVHIKVTRDDAGNWNLYIDTLGSTNFNAEGNAFDNTYLSTKYFGVYAKYTATNAAKFYWDDFLVKQTKTDSVAPKLIAVEVLNSNQLQLTFSEALSDISAANISHYTVNNGIGNPQSANLITGAANKVLLTFSKAFSGNTLYTITVSGVEDEAGNIAGQQALQFQFKEYKKLDIVINELMPDPAPQIDLPEAEFIELYNSTSETINLKNWSITDGTSTGILGNDSLAANSYAIVVAAPNASQFSSYGKVISVANLPSLNNTSDNISLLDANKKLIDKVSYNIGWYKDKSKESGGYSLEKINPLDSCRGDENWAASNDIRGGTPGTQNSVFNNLPDTSKPVLINISVIDSVTINLVFNEAIDSISAAKATYVLSNGAMLQKLHILPGKKMLQLVYDIPFDANKSMNITVSGLKDCNGNLSNAITRKFTYYKPQKAKLYDVELTEIMANPNTDMALPNTEYIELYNLSRKVISLKNFTYGDANTKVLLPEFLLLPDSFVVLCPEANVNALSPFCRNIIGLKSWPSLNNSSDSLFLYNAENELIYFLNYSDKWYNDEQKKQGGWSLEMIDKYLPCLSKENFTASKDKNGGTPGKQNSVNGILKNSAAPEAISVQIIDSQTVIVEFDKVLDTASGGSESRYYILPFNDVPQKATALSPAFTKVKLELKKPLQINVLYKIQVSQVRNCSMIMSEEKTLEFGLPMPAKPGDIVINEILFNPNTGGSDFVEIYNNSVRIIDLKEVKIANRNENGAISDVKNLSNVSRLILPGDYFVFTEDAENIAQNYHIASPEKMLEVNSLPGFPDDSGTVVLLFNNRVLDEVSYSADWHFDLLNDENGVSLEKINPGFSSNISSSWHSASSNAGYATPTYQNSQYQSSMQKKPENPFVLEPPVFSPDNDGYQDVLNIFYDLKESGTAAKFEVYDIQGRLVKQVSKNILLGTKGYLSWDGLTDSGTKAPIGVYVLLISTFKPNGETETYKLSCTLAGRL